MFLLGDGDYGFLSPHQLPKGRYIARTIDDASSVAWMTTSEVSDLAKNHCAAVAATNIALYHAHQGAKQLLVNDDRVATFQALHRIVNNGPVAMLVPKVRIFYRQRGVPMHSQTSRNLKALKFGVRNNLIQAALLVDGLFNWHWVLVVGYRQYQDGRLFLQLVNGWEQTTEKYYEVGAGSFWMSSTTYWLE
ncbi:hypothetical protein BSR29_08145 [Boudabousia liubingyangii]|uniref:Peptidase C39-like domain-containing protein n=1 Tax=Boudabousia liubingyangii TaxID=1921764 RepID=A0A1Q5PJT9_9ACTO|nr:hypothetical protein [Boudabousia liubingyangii]OKL46207.1 hypothetical protein BSR29_08145 [Boudabousia liubingyangii]